MNPQTSQGTAVASRRLAVPVIVTQHADDAASLRGTRTVLVRAPHVKLLHLARLDERLAAHLDGLSVGGSTATALLREMLDRPTAGVVFALAVGALESHDAASLDRLVALGLALPEAWRALLSAFGWVPAAQLQGTVRGLLDAADAPRRALGLAACRLHGVDPGPAVAAALRSGDARLVEAGLHAAADLARRDLLEAVRDAMAHDDPAVAARAALATAMLGDAGAARPALQALARGAGDVALQALALLVLGGEATATAAWLQSLAAEARAPQAPPALKRLLVRACGLWGDAAQVPWLMEVMRDDTLTRLAGEAFSWITGADLALLDLERKPPEPLPGGPSEDAADADVALDDDESLPWPDRDRLQAWWARHEARFAQAPRWFMGEPPGLAAAERVLREGAQRQRALAALWRVVLAPGTPRFNVCAPVGRQRRLLAGQPA